MKKEFSLSTDKAIINLTAKYCTTPVQLLKSKGLTEVLDSYLKMTKRKEDTVYKFFSENFKTEDLEVIRENLINVLKLLVIMSIEEAAELNNEYNALAESKHMFNKFVEAVYGYWRRLERYTIVQNLKVNEGFGSVSFLEANENFSALVLRTYRRIQEHVLGEKPTVFRQLPAGSNVGLVTSNYNWDMPENYSVLKDILLIDTVIINPPFISYPKKNTRKGVFNEVFENPLESCEVNEDHYFCYPIKVGESLAFVYFHRDFMAHGVTLCNLFEMAKPSEFKNRKPDIVYLLGGRDDDGTKTCFYDDKENDIMVGYVSYSEDIDYFGYMKKMTLTLHNLRMIKKGFIPIHGAMVNLKLKSGKESNVIIMGDSGAGKSESLEAFRVLSEDYINEMTIIFDDMGIVKIENGKAVGYGTEIGAFIRLDDLDPGYAFKEIDRSIFMNPDKTNARLVMPIATYEDIMKGYEIDMFLYANNYDNGIELDYFKTPEEALEIFRSGARMAKGTTAEVGLVKSYFANPFGPVQKQAECDVLLEQYFDMFFKTGVKVGQLRTRLGIAGEEKDGPLKAASYLLNAIKEL